MSLSLRVILIGHGFFTYLGLDYSAGELHSYTAQQASSLKNISVNQVYLPQKFNEL